MQVPEALGWTIYQRIQQDERKCPGSEIHPKSHGPQAQVRAQLSSGRGRQRGQYRLQGADPSSKERGMAQTVVGKTQDKSKLSGAWSPPVRPLWSCCAIVDQHKPSECGNF